jgi:hypothetical protein
MMRRNPALFNRLWSLAYPYVIRRDEKYFGSEYGDRDAAFQTIFAENRWGSAETRSGSGSTFAYTAPLRKSLSSLLARLNVKVFLDVPCGDFNWMRHVDMPEGTSYLGGDIVLPLVEELQEKYGGATRSFRQIDIVEGPLPTADLWLCRDVLFHLPNLDIAAVLENFTRSGIPLMLTTTYDFPKWNADVRAGGFRFINLRRPPFALPRPLTRIPDFVAPEPPRYLALWSREQVAGALSRDLALEPDGIS